MTPYHRSSLVFCKLAGLAFPPRVAMGRELCHSRITHFGLGGPGRWHGSGQPGQGDAVGFRCQEGWERAPHGAGCE